MENLGLFIPQTEPQKPVHQCHDLIIFGHFKINL